MRESKIMFFVLNRLTLNSYILNAWEIAYSNMHSCISSIYFLLSKHIHIKKIKGAKKRMKQ